MDEEKLPDSHFVMLPMTDNKILSVDIGSESVVDYTVNSNEKQTIMTRKSVVDRTSETKFTLYYPSLPLDAPEYNTVICEDDYVRCSKVKSTCVGNISCS